MNSWGCRDGRIVDWDKFFWSVVAHTDRVCGQLECGGRAQEQAESQVRNVLSSYLPARHEYVNGLAVASVRAVMRDFVRGLEGDLPATGKRRAILLSLIDDLDVFTGTSMDAMARSLES
jgi:hypothetical protein